MKFDLSEQQREFQAAVAAYLQAECPVPVALKPHDDGKEHLAIWRGLLGLGVGEIVVPEAQGGLGLGLLDLAVIAEAVGRYAAPGPFFEHSLATLAIALGGSETQKGKWLPPLARGELRATIAVSEAKGAWAPGDWFMKSGERVSGVKQFVLHPDADLMVVCMAGAVGVVDAEEGRAAELLPSTDAGRRIGHVTFDHAKVELLPNDSGARIFDAGLVLLAADAFGGASHCVDMAVAYAKEREQFGRPIGAFQAVKHQLADMALAVAPTEGLYWRAAHLFDLGAPNASEAAALAKAHLTEIYPLVARRMIEVHGGIGYTWEFGAHIWLKRALFDQAYFGMPQNHRARIAQMAGW